MYHPDAMLRIAHTREAELLREAQICGLPKKVEAHDPGLLGLVMMIGLWLAVLVTVVGLFLG